VTVDKNVDFPTEGKPISATKLKKIFWKVYRPGLMYKILQEISPNILYIFPKFNSNVWKWTRGGGPYGSGQGGK